jgi:hypothetical protein
MSGQVRSIIMAWASRLSFVGRKYSQPKFKIESPIISFNKKVESSFKPFTYQPEEIDLATT